MGRHWKIALAVLAALVLFSLATFPALFRSVLRLKRATATEEQARRDIAQTPISTPTDAPQKAQMYWISESAPATLEPSEVQLPLSADPVQRAKQLIAALILQAPTPAQRTLPADVQLLQLYLLSSDGSAIADFSEALGTETPSGILSEQMAVDSIVRTLAANVGAVHRLKILIHGQEADTLAGHIDLTGFFPVESPAPTPSGSPVTATTATLPSSSPASRSAPSTAPANSSAPH